MNEIWHLAVITALVRTATTALKAVADLLHARITARAAVDQRRTEGSVIVQLARALGTNHLAMREEHADGSRLIIAPADTLNTLGEPRRRPRQ